MFEAFIQHLSGVLGLPDDQVRFISLLLMGYPLALVLRHILHPSSTSLHVRHLFSSLSGLTLAALCYGWQVLVLVGGVAVGYIILLVAPPQTVQRWSMGWIMVFTSAGNLYSILNDYSGLHLDLVSSVVKVSDVSILLCSLFLIDGLQLTLTYRFVHEHNPEAVVIRCRFYFVFLLNDSISNAAGLGFEGYDEQNRPKWGLASNVDIMSIELSMNARNSLNSWNITSSRWIRRVVYERVSWSPTVASFLFSAWWHGFYPGYHLGFFAAGLTLMASKKMRRWCNPFFTSHGPVLKWTYHIATWVLTQVYVTYGSLAVCLVWFPAVWTFWSHYYFVPTVAALLVLLLVPSRQSQRHKDSHDVNGDVKSGPSSDSNTKHSKQD